MPLTRRLWHCVRARAQAARQSTHGTVAGSANAESCVWCGCGEIPDHIDGLGQNRARTVCLRRPSASNLAFSPPPGLAQVQPPQLAFAAGEFLENQKNQMGEFFSEGWTRTKQGFSLLWKNWNVVREVQSRKSKGDEISLNEFCMVARNKKDTGKLIRAIGVYAMSPSLLPYYLIFWPGALPSTFDLPKHQESKYVEAVACRVDGLLTGLMGLDKETLDEKNPAGAAQALVIKEQGVKALSSGSWKAAMHVVKPWLYYNQTALGEGKEPRANLEGLPPSLVKGAALATGGGLGWLPAFILKFPLKSHLVSLIEGDAEMAKPGLAGKVADLSRHDLLDLCLERGLGHPQWPRPKLQQSLLDYAANLDDLYSTLRATRPSPDMEVDPFRVRLALFGLDCAMSARVLAAGELTRSLYAGASTPKLGF